MMLFFLGLVIGSIGGMIMMAMFLTGKSRESSFNENKHGPSGSATTGDCTEKH
jgi:hypothetical protein